MDKALNIPGNQSALCAQVRTDSYILLASLLGHPPSVALRDVLVNLQWDDAVPDGLGRSLTALSQAGCACAIESMQAEYQKLFVGLGSGELIPYASWYLEKRIQSRPLAKLRSDLYRLGVVRQAGDHEPEDHAAALCEVMTILSDAAGGYPLDTQIDFFERHLATWITGFFHDLRMARSAVFYRSVGAFGSHFMECESRYLGCDLLAIPFTKRRNRYENEFFRQPADVS